MKFLVVLAIIGAVAVSGQEATRDKRGVLLGTPGIIGARAILSPRIVAGAPSVVAHSGLISTSVVGAPSIIGARTIVSPGVIAAPGIIGAHSILAPGVIGPNVIIG